VQQQLLLKEKYLIFATVGNPVKQDSIKFPLPLNYFND